MVRHGMSDRGWEFIKHLFPEPERPQVKRRLGVCYRDGTIRIRLLHATTGRPLKYSSLVNTLCHELAHLRHMNHSAAFWRLVEAVYPGHRAARQALREAFRAGDRTPLEELERLMELEAEQRTEKLAGVVDRLIQKMIDEGLIGVPAVAAFDLSKIRKGIFGSFTTVSPHRRRMCESSTPCAIQSRFSPISIST